MEDYRYQKHENIQKIRNVSCTSYNTSSQVGDVILGVDGQDFSVSTSTDEANSVLNAANDTVSPCSMP